MKKAGPNLISVARGELLAGELGDAVLSESTKTGYRSGIVKARDYHERLCAEQLKRPDYVVGGPHDYTTALDQLTAASPAFLRNYFGALMEADTTGGSIGGARSALVFHYSSKFNLRVSSLRFPSSCCR